MARFLRFLLLITAVFGSAGLLHAAPLNFNVLSAKKRFDVARSDTGSTKISKEQWGFNVTLENKSFQALTGLDVQYKQFKFAADRKGGGTFQPVPGSIKIDTLANGAKFKFDTAPVEIEKSELKANWSTSDGSKEKVKDELAGYWLRVMKDGQMVFEHQYPPDLGKKVKWE